MSGHLAVVEPFVIGLQLGRINAPAAVAILERVPGKREQDPPSHELRYLKRWPAGTAYPIVVRTVGLLLHFSPVAPDDGRRFDPLHRLIATEIRGGMAACVVNATGVGKAALELFADQAPDVRTVATWVTTGDQALEGAEGWRVPQRDLVAAVQVLQEQHRINYADELPDYEEFRRQMEGFKVEPGNRGRDHYDPKAGEDLVMAVALACWWGELVSPGRVEWVTEELTYQEALASEIRKRRITSKPTKPSGPMADGVG